MIAVATRTAPADLYPHCQEIPEYVAVKIALEASGKKPIKQNIEKSLKSIPKQHLIEWTLSNLHILNAIALII